MLNMDRWQKLSGLLGALAVMAGAFGAHMLKDKVTVADLEIWKTGAQYQLIHSVAMLAASSSGGRAARALPWWLAGVVIFAGSLYLLVLTGQRWFGAITPLGGVSLIIGWATLAISSPKQSSSPAE